MTPCKANKCISYPMCLGKIRIDCPQLREHFTNLLVQDDKYTHRDVWNLLKKDLPRLTSVSITSVRRFGEYEP